MSREKRLAGRAGTEKARHVKATRRATGAVFHGVQDVVTGVVYPFTSEKTCVEVVADVNAGKESLTIYGSLQGDDYVIEEVA